MYTPPYPPCDPINLHDTMRLVISHPCYNFQNLAFGLDWAEYRICVGRHFDNDNINNDSNGDDNDGRS